jgi:hypothetical protein
MLEANPEGELRVRSFDAVAGRTMARSFTTAQDPT